MGCHPIISMASMASLLLLLIAIPTSVEAIGVCYGMHGDNLPQPSDVVALYKSNNIGAMRIYSPDQATLQALGGSNIQLILDVPESYLQSLASDPSAAAAWVQTNVQAYSSSVAFRYIAVGNEVIPGNLAQYVFPAMQNVQTALSSAGLSSIKVSTAVALSVLGNSYPPSAGVFSSDSSATLGPIIQFLASNGAPLLVNVYPYFGYTGNPGSIDLSYALFTASGTMPDGSNAYQNLFDAMVDSVYSALEKTGGSNVGIVVSESGWPSAGGTAATVGNAQTYNSNLIKHVGQGTPKRPGTAIETYVFAMFNEDRKMGQGTENNFGLFFPNKQPVYSISFN